MPEEGEGAEGRGQIADSRGQVSRWQIAGADDQTSKRGTPSAVRRLLSAGPQTKKGEAAMGLSSFLPLVECDGSYFVAVSDPWVEPSFR
jgi:hypothetical protein